MWGPSEPSHVSIVPWILGHFDTYIASQLAVVQVSLEDDELGGLELLKKLGVLLGQTPEAAAGSPVAVGTHDELALRMELGPVLEDEGEVVVLSLGQRGGDLVLKLLVLGLRLEESPGVGDGVEEGAEVSGQNVGDEPGDRLGTQDNLGGQAGGEQESGQDEVDVELEAGVVEDKVDATLRLALIASLLEQLVGLREVVDENVLLSLLAGLGTLQLLDVLVGHVGEERKVGGVAPEANLKHLGEKCLLGLNVVGGILIGLERLDKLPVARGQLENSLARGAEGVDLLAGKDVITLPVLGEAEEGAYAPFVIMLVCAHNSELDMTHTCTCSTRRRAR